MLPRQNLIYRRLKPQGHVIAPKQRSHTLLAIGAHTTDILIRHRQHAEHDSRPRADIFRVAQPASLRVLYRLDGTARVGGKDRHAGEHGLEGHDAEVLVGGGVDQEPGHAQEGGFDGVWYGEEEEDGGVAGNGREGGRFEGCDGVVFERAGGGEGFELGVVFDVFGNSGVVAAWAWLT